MFRVRVNKIESICDMDGNLGKRIELVEDRSTSQFIIRPQSEEARVVQEVFQALQQQLPIFQARAQFTIPKIILFLTEQEYEELGIDFDVNQVYDIILDGQSIKFKKTS
ncbi:MAG: arcadin 1 [Candidatus Bathyarchaeia archaeon]